jgi:hypothetical protein
MTQLFLQTCTPNIERSKTYFENLDFELQDKGDYTLVYDQQLRIMIDHSRQGRKGLTLLKENWDLEIDKIGRLVSVIEKENVHYFVGPSGTRFALVSGSSVDIPEAQSKCILGNYAGISLETMDIKKSMEILQILGLEQHSGSIEQGWISCMDQYQNTISLMKPFACPHLFVNPSGTFFNGGSNPDIITEVRKRQIPIYEEITAFNTKSAVDNIIIQEPGGLGFFVFND